MLFMCENGQCKGWTCVRECVGKGVRRRYYLVNHFLHLVDKCFRTTRLINRTNLRLSIFRNTLCYRQHGFIAGALPLSQPNGYH
jgi:hypothetical protein